jgi:glycerophosphoryl diester phosphodiesterase
MSLVERALKVLASYNGPYGVMSFDPDVVARVRELSPSTIRGIVADKATHEEHGAIPVSRRLEMRKFGHGRQTMPHFISFHWRDLPYEPVTRFRAKGGPVISWTIRTAREAASALRYSDQITFEGFRA